MSNDAVTVIIFLIGQLLINIAVLAHISTRLTKVETHLIHLMKKHGMQPRENDFDRED